MDDTTRRLSQDIAQTRAQMSETIDAIEEKLRPGAIVANATERVKAVTSEKARAMAETAEDMAKDVMDRTRETARDVMNRTRDTAGDVADRTRDVAGSLADTIRKNPLPAALIGAGFAWWAFSRMRSAGDTSWKSVRGGSTDGYEAASSFTRNASRYAGETGRAIGRSGRRASDQVGRMMTDNPLLIGAGALLVGAALGLAIPGSEREDRWMGDTRDSFFERAQQAAGDAARRLRQTATEVANAANSVAQSVNGRDI
jgi:ElaB/YqjD/DUF883 family membrane-anchored ribosome-binding protein